MIKSKRGAEIVWSNIVSIIIVLIFVLLVGYWIVSGIVPHSQALLTCSMKGGHCADSCPVRSGVTTFTGPTDCVEGQVCCLGLDEYEIQTLVEGSGSTSGTIIQTTCPVGSFCYKLLEQSEEGAGYHTLNQWTSAQCLYESNAKPPVPNKKVELTASISGAKCCKLQLGGISGDVSNNPEFNYFSQNVISQDGTIEDGVCSATIPTFDFESPGDNFNKDLWLISSDTRGLTNCNDNSKKKAMFKLDFVYWTDESDCAGPSSKTIANADGSMAALINIPALDPTSPAAIGGTGSGSGGGVPGGVDYYVKVLVKDRNYIFNPSNTLACELTCLTNFEDKSKQSCKQVSMLYVDIDEECPTDYRDYDKKFVENSNLIGNGFIVPRPDKKLCFIGTYENKYSVDTVLPGMCNVVYYIDTINENSPKNVCDEFNCGSNGLKNNENTCNYLFTEIHDGAYSNIFYYYNDDLDEGFCANKKCYFGKDPDVWSWLTNNNCKDCDDMGINECSDYNLEQACFADSCGVSSSPNLCAWNDDSNSCETFSCNSISNCGGYNNFNDLIMNELMCGNDICGYGDCVWDGSYCHIQTNTVPMIELCDNINTCEAYFDAQDLCEDDFCGVEGDCIWNGNYCETDEAEFGLRSEYPYCSVTSVCEDYVEYNPYPEQQVCLIDPCNLERCYWDSDTESCDTFSCGDFTSCEDYEVFEGSTTVNPSTQCGIDSCFYSATNSECSWLQGGCYDCPTGCNLGMFHNDKILCELNENMLAPCAGVDCYYDSSQSVCHDCPATCEEIVSFNSEVCYNAYDLCNGLDCFYDLEESSMNACHSCDSITSCNNDIFNQNEYLCTHPADNCLNLCYYNINSCYDCPNTCGNLLSQEDCVIGSDTCPNLLCYWDGNSCEIEI